MSIEQIRRQIYNLLSAERVEEATAISRLLICDTLGIGMTELFTRGEQDLDCGTETKLLEMASRVAKGEPMQYVTGRAEFCGMPLLVGEGVLIPRPETEELVEWVAGEADGHEKITDLCTGSGCIAIALRKKLPGTQIGAVDISERALAYARRNAARQCAEIGITCKNIFDDDYALPSDTDIVVSNPPYVMASERAEMSDRVRGHEPAEALFVDDERPLVFYERIADLCIGTGRTVKLYFEINEAKGEDMRQLLKSKGFADVEIRKDFTGRDRMARGIIWR